MRIRLLAPLACLMLMLCLPGGAHAASARRIITLSPHATELVFQLGAGDRIVGTVDFSDYPAAARSIPRIGGYQAIDIERLLTLTPDLVITWPSGNPPRALTALEKRQLPILASDPATLADIANDLRRIATRLGIDERGEQEARILETGIGRLRTRYAGRPPVTVFYEVWDKPLYTLGGKHYFNDLLAVCGGRNIFADLQQPSPQVSLETVMARDPQVILGGARDGALSETQWHTLWERWPTLTAVKTGRLYQVNPDIFTRPTGRVLEAASSLCEWLDAAREPH